VIPEELSDKSRVETRRSQHLVRIRTRRHKVELAEVVGISAQRNTNNPCTRVLEPLAPVDDVGVRVSNGVVGEDNDECRLVAPSVDTLGQNLVLVGVGVAVSGSVGRWSCGLSE
jgi:hypothetical protein